MGTYAYQSIHVFQLYLSTHRFMLPLLTVYTEANREASRLVQLLCV